MRLGNATGAFLASALPLPCLCTLVPSVLEEGLGAGGLHTAKGSSRENSVRGKEGQLQGSSSGCLAAQIQRHTESTRLPGPLAGVFCPDTRRLIPLAPRKCMTEVGSLALSSPAETCAGGWGLILRVWLPAHSPN